MRTLLILLAGCAVAAAQTPQTVTMSVDAGHFVASAVRSFSGSGALTKALAAVPSGSSVAINIPSSYADTLSADTSVPDGATLAFAPGAKVTLASCKLLTIYGNLVDTKSQIFSLPSPCIRPVTFSGSGTNNATSGGTFTGRVNTVYRITVTTGSPDKFTWTATSPSSVICNGVAAPSACGAAVNITGSAQALNNGVTVTFGATTGHSGSEVWTFTAVFSGVTYGSTVNQHKEGMRPEMFGGHPDDSTDNSTFIQACIVATQGQGNIEHLDYGGVLNWSGGAYRFSTPLVISGSLDAGGVNSQSTTLRYTGSTAAPMFGLYGGRPIHLHDFAIDNIGSATKAFFLGNSFISIERIHSLPTVGFTEGHIGSLATDGILHIQLHDLYLSVGDTYTSCSVDGLDLVAGDFDVQAVNVEGFTRYGAKWGDFASGRQASGLGLHNYFSPQCGTGGVGHVAVGEYVSYGGTQLELRASRYEMYDQVVATGSTTSGSTAVTLTASDSRITTGELVTGTGIFAGTTVSAVSGTSVTLSHTATATGSGVTLTFEGTLNHMVQHDNGEHTLISGNAMTGNVDVPLLLSADSTTNGYVVIDGNSFASTGGTALLDPNGSTKYVWINNAHNVTTGGSLGTRDIVGTPLLAYAFYTPSTQPWSFGGTVYGQIVSAQSVTAGGLNAQNQDVAPCTNLTGHAVVTGPASTVGVAFNTAMGDTNYGVLLTADNNAGFSPSGTAVYTAIVWPSGQTTSGFTINMGTAPSTTVRVRWQVLCGQDGH